MASLYHLNCGYLTSPFIGEAICHCLLIEQDHQLVLIDTGIGLSDVRHAALRLGQQVVDQFQIRLNEADTAIHQIRELGFDPEQVKDCVLTHLDFDHAGGLSDFPSSRVHVSAEEYGSFASGNQRYSAPQFEHGPDFVIHDHSDLTWFGMPARQIDTGLDVDIMMIPLFGHTRGHCGVAIGHNEGWLFYVGDAFYLVNELDSVNHPVTVLSQASAEDNFMRLESFEKVRYLKSYPGLQIYCYHDRQGFERFKNVKSIL